VAVHYSEDQNVGLVDTVDHDILADGEASRSGPEVFIADAPHVGMLG